MHYSHNTNEMTYLLLAGIIDCVTIVAVEGDVVFTTSVLCSDCFDVGWGGVVDVNLPLFDFCPENVFVGFAPVGRGLFCPRCCR